MPTNPAPADNFTTTLFVDQTPDEMFAAINNVRGWWGEDVEGSTDSLGEFTYRHEDIHRCTIRVTELVPGERVVWHVVDNFFAFTEDETEWKGTEVRFEIARSGDKTELHLHPPRTRP